MIFDNGFCFVGVDFLFSQVGFVFFNISQLKSTSIWRWKIENWFDSVGTDCSDGGSKCASIGHGW